MNNILNSHEIHGVLNRFSDAFERAENYYCAGIGSVKERELRRDQLEDFKCREWVSKAHFLYGVAETIRCINEVIKDSESHTNALTMLEDLRTWLRSYKEVKNE